jgi:putative CocE/NonD family hydrolase
MKNAARIFLLIVFLSCGAAQVEAAAPDFEFHPPASASDATTTAVMRDLAERLLPVYEEPDPDRYLAELSALQMVAGNYVAASVSRQSLRDRRRRADLARAIGRPLIYDIYARARAIETERHLSFADGFADSFHETAVRLNDQEAFAVIEALRTSPDVFREALQKALDRQRSKDTISQAEAVDLIRAYLSFDAYRNFGPLVESLAIEDDQQRYSTDNEVVIKTPDGSSIAALVVRPVGGAKSLPALLEYTNYDSQNYAKECAAHGYVGVVAYARGRRGASQAIVPYQRDGDDARAVIDWIAKQPWSDGRVGMYGDGYSGFTSWSAAKQVPRALKAIATSAASAPGVNLPMGGNIFQNSAYRWSLEMSNTAASAESADSDDAHWRALDQKWYRSGRRYRDIGRLNGQPDPLFQRWLNHPSYDAYWQKMIPYRGQFAHINIPVLTISGYFAAAEPGALYYFTQHHKYNAHADHTLVIGPYDDNAMRQGPVAALHGYEVDSSAVIDLHELRYAWFDHIFKGAATPSLLKDRVNFEVMGANVWRHAASLEAMAGGTQRYFLDASAPKAGQRLTRTKSSKPAFIQQTLSFVDRSDAGWLPSSDLVSKRLVTHNGMIFVSDVLKQPIEVDGLLSGRLDFVVNKMDVDLNIMLYERLAGGDYVRLFDPTYEFRASYAQDRVHRQLLKAGERQELSFGNERMTSRRIQAGSRLVLVLGLNKRPDREINYGTGNDVSEESIADGKIPLRIRWYNDSYIEIPVFR